MPFPKSLYFLPAWQKNKRDPTYIVVHTAVFIGWVYCPSRCGHNAICINDDLIIWAGYNEQDIGYPQYCEKDALWVYNLENDFWFSVRTEGPGPTYRSGAVSVFSWPHWYIISGHTADGNIGDVHALNILTLKWEKIKSLPGLSKRDKASGWCWRNRLYVFGGYGPKATGEIWDASKGDRLHLDVLSDYGWNNQLAYFDLGTKEWVIPNTQGKRPLARAAHSSAVVRNSVYIFGGRNGTVRMNDLHRLDLESDVWSDNIVCLGEYPCGRSWHCMTKSDSSHLFLFGGFSNENVPLEDAWRLNIDTYSWQLLTRKSGFPRLWHTASVNSHGDILVFGGCESNILDRRSPLVTCNKVILFKTQPFSLQRMCLHTLYKHRRKTIHLWDNLPRDCCEWLHFRCQFALEMSPDYYEHTAALGFGPSLSGLSVMSQEEAARLNYERRTVSAMQGMDLRL